MSLDEIRKKLFSYRLKIDQAFDNLDSEKVQTLLEKLLEARSAKRVIFVAGNGGSAANALHISNDLSYPVSKVIGKGFPILPLTANISVISCIANDESYDEVFSHQLSTIARENDLLICLSGSGNSKNILELIKIAKSRNLYCISITGFDGGLAAKLADLSICTEIYDMQIAEDFQTILFHIITQYIYENSLLK